MEYFNQDTIDQLELLLVARSTLFAVLFLLVAIVAFRTNQQKRLAVSITGMVGIVLFIVNMILAVQWIRLFYF